MTTNDPQHAKETLTCEGQVLVPFTAVPRFANLVKIEDFTTPQPVVVTIKRGDGGPLQLEVVRTGVPGIEADLREVKPGDIYELVIGLSPPQIPPKLRSWVQLKTGIAEAPEMNVPVYADIPPSWAPAAFSAASP